MTVSGGHPRSLLASRLDFCQLPTLCLELRRGHGQGLVQASTNSLPAGPRGQDPRGRWRRLASVHLSGPLHPDLRHIDFPVNSGAVVAFPTRMTVFQSRSLEFKWDDLRKSGAGIALNVGAAVAAALGLLTVKASVRLAFRNSVEEHEEYERLDTYFVQLNRPYIDQCLRTKAMQAYIADKRDWAFFMITGIKVARAGKRATQRAKGAEVGGGPEVDVPGMGTVKATGSCDRDSPRTTEEKHLSDFVWAVRLAKVHEGILMTDWSVDPYSHRATFGVGEDKEMDVGVVVKGEGLCDAIVVEDSEANEAVVLDAAHWKET